MTVSGVRVWSRMAMGLVASIGASQEAQSQGGVDRPLRLRRPRNLPAVPQTSSIAQLPCMRITSRCVRHWLRSPRPVACSCRTARNSCR